MRLKSCLITPTSGSIVGSSAPSPITSRTAAGGKTGSISPNSPRPTRRQAPSDASSRRRDLKTRRGLQRGGAGQDEFHNFTLAAGIRLSENLPQLRADRVHADAPF